MDGDRVVFTALFHIQRGQCCGNGCKNCAYEPKYQKGNKIFQEQYLEKHKK
jgi:2-iminoacetate synthase ThiH